MMRCSRIRGRDRERDEMERNDDNDDEVSNNDWVKTMQTIQPVGVTTRAKTSVIVMTCCVDSLILKISLVSTFIPIFNPHSLLPTLPVPGGPHNIKLGTLPSAATARSRIKVSSLPTTSSSERGRYFSTHGMPCCCCCCLDIILLVVLVVVVEVALRLDPTVEVVEVAAVGGI